MASLWVNVASGKRLASSSVSSDAWRLSPQNASARAACSSESLSRVSDRPVVISLRAWSQSPAIACVSASSIVSYPVTSVKFP